MVRSSFTTFFLAFTAAVLFLSAVASADDDEPCTSLVAQMTRIASAHVPGEPGHIERSRCLSMEPRFIQACADIIDAYGLEGVHDAVSAGREFLCEHARAGPIPSEDGSDGREAKSIAEAAAEKDVKIIGDSADVLIASAPAAAGAVAGLNAIGGGLSMLNQQATSQQSQMVNDLNSATEKLRRAEARSRALSRDMRQLRKETWRAQPGHCDCCDGCLAPE